MNFRVGRVRITRVVEYEGPGGMRRFLPQASREAVRAIPWLQPHFANEEGRMLACIQALVVDTGERRIVVDTCVGNDKERALPAWHRMRTAFLADLGAAGYPRESIDTVLCTHLHVDHVGWNTMLVDGRWTPTFPNARYLFGADELAHWQAEGHDEQRVVMADSVQPVLDAGLADLVRTDHVICDEVRLLPTPGHTPGHVSVLVESDGESALVSGDFVHHPCQLAHPEWCSVVDVDPARAVRTRQETLARFAGAPALFIGTHFATPTAGRVVTDGAAFRLRV